MHRIAFVLATLATLITGCAHALDPVSTDDAPTPADVPDAAPPVPDAGPMPSAQDDSGRDANDAATDAPPDAPDAATDALDAGPSPSHANDPIVPPDAGGRTIIDGQGDYTMPIIPDAGRQLVNDAGNGVAVAVGADGGTYLCSPSDAPANDTNCEAINGATEVFCVNGAGCLPVYACTVGEVCAHSIDYAAGTARTGYTLYCGATPPSGRGFVVELPDGGGLYGSGLIAKPPAEWMAPHSTSWPEPRDAGPPA